MQKEFSISKWIKITSIAYCVLTVLFFVLMNLAAGFLQEADKKNQEQGVVSENTTGSSEQTQSGSSANTEIKLTGYQNAIAFMVPILAYVEMFGYFGILFLVFLHFQRKNRYVRMRQQIPATEKFPTVFFAIGLLAFLFFMNTMSAMTR